MNDQNIPGSQKDLEYQIESMDKQRELLKKKSIHIEMKWKTYQRMVKEYLERGRNSQSREIFEYYWKLNNLSGNQEEIRNIADRLKNI